MLQGQCLPSFSCTLCKRQNALLRNTLSIDQQQGRGSRATHDILKNLLRVPCTVWTAKKTSVIMAITTQADNVSGSTAARSF
jgi:hypothetical protein